ncbi:MAG: hypothetical protein II643_00635 [Oscillospiraceae bacterium]|nr:hypothetical protein [Oscillospiraceae bacterium]
MRLYKKLIIAALVIACIAAFRFGAVFKDRTEPVSGYTVFFVGADRYLSSYGETEETLPPYIIENEIYVPALTVLKGLGGEIFGGKIRFGGQDTELSDYLRDDGTEEFVSAEELCSRFGLCRREYQDMLQIGFEMEDIDADQRALIAEELGYVRREKEPEKSPEGEAVRIDPYRKSTYDTVVSWVNDLEKAYPDLVTSFDAGTSVEGRTIPGFTMGRGERVIYMEAAIHASEYVTSNVIAYIADRYLAGYREDTCEEGYISYRELLDSFTFYIVPQVNPDGVNIAQHGFRASTLPVWKYDAQGADYPYQYKANANGVDLNRNFPYHWDPKLENGIMWPARRYYCGPEAASEPETRMIIDIMRNIPAEAFIDIHKFGETLNWIDSDATEEYRSRYSALAKRMAKDSGFEDLGCERVKFGGYAMNYNLHVNDVFSCVVEVCRLYPYNEGQLDKIIKRIWRLGLVLGEELLKLDDRKEGLRIELDGRTLVAISDASRRDDAISLTQLETIIEAVGGDVHYDDQGDVSVSFNGKNAVRSCSDTLKAGEDVYAVAADGRCVNATHLLADLGVSIILEGKTVKVTGHR